MLTTHTYPSNSNSPIFTAPEKELSGTLHHINPFTSSDTLTGQIKDAAGILFANKKGNYYKSFWGGPMWQWPGVFGSGRDEFITVAKSVWIK